MHYTHGKIIVSSLKMITMRLEAKVEIDSVQCEMFVVKIKNLFYLSLIKGPEFFRLHHFSMGQRV